MFGRKKKGGSSVDKSIVVKRGWLYRKGKYTNSWKPRLFSLTNSGELQYYHTAKSPEPSGIITVSDVQRMKISEEYSQKNFVIELYTPEKLWALAVDEREEAHQWMFALQLVQDKQINDFNDLLQVQDAIGTIQELNSPRVEKHESKYEEPKINSEGVLQPVKVDAQAPIQPKKPAIETNNDLSDIFGLSTPPTNSTPIQQVDPFSMDNMLMPEKLITPTPVQNAENVPSPVLSPTPVRVPIEKSPEKKLLPATKAQTANKEILEQSARKESLQTSKQEKKIEVEPQQINKSRDKSTEQLKIEPVNVEEQKAKELVKDPVEIPKNPSPVEKTKQVDIHSHTRSASDVGSPVRDEENTTEKSDPNLHSHIRSPSDGAITTTTPQKFEPLSIDTNWQSLHVRTMQIRTLQAWVNYHIKKIGIQIDDVSSAFCSGELLCQLVEIFTGTEIGYNEEPSHVAFMHQNVNFALFELRKAYPDIPTIATHEIISGKLSSTLEMIWNIFETVELSKVEFRGTNGQEGLLLWIQHRMQPYELIVTDFQKNFVDGRIFCALVHSTNPSLIDYYSYTPRRKDMLQKALDYASSTFEIPQLVSVDDLDNKKVDPVSIVIYLTQWYLKMGYMD